MVSAKLLSFLLSWQGLWIISILLITVYWWSESQKRSRSRKFDTAVRSVVLTNNIFYPFGVMETIGRRPYMEDRYAVIGEIKPGVKASLYCVFDGHGGYAASEFCATNIGHLLSSNPRFPSAPPEALHETFLSLDEKFGEKSNFSAVGTTAIAVLAIGKELYVANVGDSRAILVQAGGTVVPLSYDHKPNRPEEVSRIKAAGGRICYNGVWRVNGVLAVSRAIGDFTLKPSVTAEPEISKWSISRDDVAVIVASDGLWDVLTPEDVAAICIKCNGPQHAAEMLVSIALDRGSSDNITSLVVDLTQVIGHSPRLGADGSNIIGNASSTVNRALSKQSDPPKNSTSAVGVQRNNTFDSNTYETKENITLGALASELKKSIQDPALTSSATSDESSSTSNESSRLSSSPFIPDIPDHAAENATRVGSALNTDSYPSHAADTSLPSSPSESPPNTSTPETLTPVYKVVLQDFADLKDSPISSSLESKDESKDTSSLQKRVVSAGE